MALVLWDVGYHLVDNPSSVKTFRLLSGEDVSYVEDYLLREHGGGNVVLRFALRVKQHTRHRTCGFCRQTRVETVEVRECWPPKEWFDSSCWRLIE